MGKGRKLACAAHQGPIKKRSFGIEEQQVESGEKKDCTTEKQAAKSSPLNNAGGKIVKLLTQTRIKKRLCDS